MIEFNILYFILLSISTAEFGIQVTISDLSTKLKGLTALEQPYKLNSLCRFIFWRKLLGKTFLVLSPLVLALVIFFNIHRFFSEMFDCPFCCSFWIALFTNHFYLNLDWITALLLAPITLVFVAILDKIHTHE